MIDMRQRVAQALESALPGKAYFVSPPVDAVQPCISFMELQNADIVFADDDAAISEIIYVVDIWAATARDIPPIAQAVDAQMKGIGFSRLHANDLPPDEFHLYHKNMQYTITV